MNPILDRFEQTVQRFPDKTAVSCRSDEYTFAELRKNAARLGERLAADENAVSPVGALAGRGCGTIVFFLSILYSGSFYVPLDPDMPPARLAKIIRDAGIRTILCTEDQKPVLSDAGFDGQILTMQDQGTESAKIPDATDDTPAYLIYTSGSTGEPKGVLKSQGAVVDFTETYTKFFRLGAEDVIGNQTPFFFDASAKDFYQMLFTGATLDVIPSELFVFPKTLIDYLNEKKITYICWVPTALAGVTQLNTFQEVLPASLKKVFFVGETFPVKQLKKWMEALPDLTYVNLYGSTETAGVCCFYELPVPFTGEQVPIGHPLPNCRIFLRRVEDGHMITAPDTVGELYVTGPTLALSYWQDPEKTAEAFINLTLPDGETVRALKTGDLARYDEKGNLCFVSRDDAQIKYTGHRIELGEIETAAQSLPQIEKCCCLYNEKKQQITLFCTLTEGCTQGRREIKRGLTDLLCGYMMPNKYIILNDLPLNANGKADRMKLKELYF